MMAEQIHQDREENQRFFHCIPIEDLAERNEQSRLFWEARSAAPKIGVERFLLESDFFPEHLITTRSIVPIDDVSHISELLHQGIKNKFSMGVRTTSEHHTLFGNKLPYIMEIDSADKINTFITHTVPQWRHEDPYRNMDIHHIILMNNLPEIGTVDPSPHQFVARVRLDNPSMLQTIQPIHLILEMVTGTNKLRELDSQMEKRNTNMHDVIRYQAVYSLTRIFSGANIQIGVNYLKKELSNPEIFQMDRPFFLSPQLKDALKPEKITYIQTIFNFLSTAINDPNIQLLKRMDFLSSIGLSEIEIQGYNDDQKNIHFARIYGLRGIDDETKTGWVSLVKNRENL